MAWSSPKTWSSGYVVLAADMNNIRDQLNATAPATVSAQGDIVIASGANALARLAKSTTSTQYLANTGTSNAPAWNEVALDTGVSGTLPVGNGGTGQTSLTTGAILIGNSTSAVTMVTQTTKGQILIGDGSGPPQMLAVGSNDQVLTADSGETTGVKWSAASGNVLVDNLEDFVESGTNQIIFMLMGALSETPADGEPIGGGFEAQYSSSGEVINSTLVRGGWHLKGVASGHNATVLAGENLSAADDWTIIVRGFIEATDARRLFFGLAEDSTDPNPLANNMIGVRSESGGNYIFFTDNGGTETTNDTGTAPSGNTAHTFRIVVSGNGGTVTFFFDNAQVGSAVTSNIPSSTSMGLLFGGTRSGAGNDNDIQIQNIFCYREV